MLTAKFVACKVAVPQIAPKYALRIGCLFKFKKGELVVTKRGKGRMRQGYFSGEVLQYEIKGEDGALYMANEEELRRQL
jgi:hypothetical protein